MPGFGIPPQGEEIKAVINQRLKQSIVTFAFDSIRPTDATNASKTRSDTTTIS